MRCQTCGDETSPAFADCQRCGTPLGQPAVTPALPTYAVRGLGTAASIAVGAATLLYLPGALFPVIGAQMARRAADQRDTDLLLGAVVADGMLALPYLVAFLAGSVLVIIWTWRARKNLDAFPGALPSSSPAWAIAGWLVPLINLVVPPRVMANIARDSLWRRSTPPLVGLWWAAWLLFTFADRVVSRSEDRRYGELAETPRDPAEFQAYVDYYQDGTGGRVVPAVACLVAAVSLILLIRRISAAQQDRIARAASAWSGYPGHPAWPTPGAPVPSPGVAPAYPAQPITGPSPQVPPVAGGTIGA
ncbi:hypothetical protein GCM10023176_51940 [Micromonospora coerulea]|uniref:DUF4328 domain-containing protein n=1 Tax=Micromonospora coerulea TaxID=47856 RepID=A0ABP8SXT7_9ACTN